MRRTIHVLENSSCFSWSYIQRILDNDLEMRKVTAKFVLRRFTTNQRIVHLQTCDMKKKIVLNVVVLRIWFSSKTMVKRLEVTRLRQWRRMEPLYWINLQISKRLDSTISDLQNSGNWFFYCDIAAAHKANTKMTTLTISPYSPACSVLCITFH